MLGTNYPESSARFDFIIIGGGTAGCVLANRLSENPKHTVLLIEAGTEAKSPWVRIPAGFYKLLTNPKYNWSFQTEPEAATNNRVIATPRGKGLGGSTLINGMVYVRGQQQDFDRWAQKGCKGWSFEDVLPAFKRIEDWQLEDPDGLRGRGGPVPISMVHENPEIAQAFIDAAVAAGYSYNADYNGRSQDGFGYYQVNQRNGKRISAAKAYLEPVRSRRNLTVVTHTQVSKVEFEGRKAVAVKAHTPVGIRRWEADKEIVLSAGALHSPHILELSGVGSPDILGEAGIDVLLARKEVGENYADHYCTRMNWEVSHPVTMNELSRGWRLVREVIKYGLGQTSVLNYGTGLANGFVRTRKGLEGPDIQYHFFHASYANAAERKLDKRPGMTLAVAQLRPESRGSIHVHSADFRKPPKIRPNFLATPEDVRCMVEGMKIGRRVIEQLPMDMFRVSETGPGDDCQSDQDWENFARNNGQSIYHITGTCRMGPDENAIVSPRLQVNGLEGLRVVDASIMPDIISGNTQAATLMIAEKGAEMILEDAR